MIDETKVTAVRNAIGELAAEYERNGVPDVAITLRKIAELSGPQLIRLGNLMSYETLGVTGISLADLGA